MGEHRNQYSHWTEAGGAQNGAQLREQNARFRQTPANRAQAERGVRRVFGTGVSVSVRHFVCTRIESANRDGPTVHRLDYVPVSLELRLFFGAWPCGRIHRNSVRNRPMPHAPASSAARASPGNSIFAYRFTCMPSAVQAGADNSPLREICRRKYRRRWYTYSSSTRGDG